MNKKFLSAILLGALTLASTGSFVSCKDYDDDIKNLQTQISTLALKSDVETKLGQLQSSLASAQSAAQTAQSTAEAAKKEAAEALAAAKAADNTAEVKKLEEKIDALDAEIDAQKAELAKIKDAQDAVNAALEAVKKEVSDKMSEFEKKTQDMIAEAQKKAEATVGKVADYVTSVEFLQHKFDELTFMNGQVGSKDLKFGEKEVDPAKGEHKADRVIVYKKESYFSFTSNALVVRVNPANAIIDKSMVQVVDSKGDALDIVEIANVERYAEKNALTKGIETGLWKVELKLAETKAAADEYADAAKKIYALAINNTVSTAPTRNVLSDFELELAENVISYTGCTTLGDAQFKSEETMSSAVSLANVAIHNAAPCDVTREEAAPIPAKNGEKVHVSFKDCTAQYFYVVRDDKYAKLDQNELNAWKSYSYTGLNEICEVSKGTDIAITIPENLKTGDEVAFRIFAVNYNGVLVDADGEQFVVYVGKNQNATSVTGNITAELSETGNVYTTGWLPIDGTLVNGDKTLAALEEAASVKVKVGDDEYELNVEYSKDGKSKAATTVANKDIKYVKFSTTNADEFKAWKDNASATGQIVTLDGKELKENVIDVKLTKVLPDAETTKKAMGYSWKDGQLVNGVYTAYLYPTTTYPTIDLVWTASVDYGYKSMNQVINGLKGGAYISVANAAREDDGDKWYYKKALETIGANFDLVVSNAKSSDNVLLIDNATQRDMSIGYNYGAISSESNDPYKVVVETVKTVFTCPLGTNVQTFAWKQVEWNAGTDTKPDMKKADVNVLTYDNTATVRSVELAEYIVATNSFDNTVFGKDLKTLKSTYVTGTVKLISNGSKNEDYFKATLDTDNFTISLATQSGTTNPAADVPSTLVIELTDAFGHKNVYELPFTVKRAQ